MSFIEWQQFLPAVNFPYFFGAFIAIFVAFLKTMFGRNPLEYSDFHN